MRLIDLSALIEASPEDIPEYLRINIIYHSHANGANQAKQILNVPDSVFRNNEGWATDTITHLGTHDTTHIDAPWHYNSEIDGQRALTIDELPLEWFYNDGVVLNMTHKIDGDAITVNDIQKELARIGYFLKPLDIVLIYTGRDVFYSQPDYIWRGCGVTAQATHWLYSQGIRVMGIDAWGWDAPLNLQAKEVLSNEVSGIFWAAHQSNLSYAHIERLVNLGQLPASGFKISCFPLKIKGGSAGPSRIVGIVP